MKRELLKQTFAVLCLLFATGAFAAKHNGNIQLKINCKQLTYKLYVPDNVLDSAKKVKR